MQNHENTFIAYLRILLYNWKIITILYDGRIKKIPYAQIFIKMNNI